MKLNKYDSYTTHYESRCMRLFIGSNISTYRSERDKELDDNEMDADAVSYCKRRWVGPETRETTVRFTHY